MGFNVVTYCDSLKPLLSLSLSQTFVSPACPITMQATPSPTASPHTSPGKDLQPERVTPVYPAPPLNATSPPFGVLVGLYNKLQSEKKPEKRRKALAGWFNVCRFSHLILLSQYILSSAVQKHWRDEVGYDLYPVLRLLLPQVSNIL